MGKLAGQTIDLTDTLLAGTFGGTGQSAAVAMRGQFNISLSGAGTVRVERSFDGGSTFFICSKPVGDGTVASFALTAGNDVSLVFEEPEDGVLYRLNCTAFTSTVTYRVSR